MKCQRKMITFGKVPGKPGLWMGSEPIHVLDGWKRRIQRDEYLRLGRVLSRRQHVEVEQERSVDGEYQRLAWTLLELQRRAYHPRTNYVQEEKDLIMKVKTLAACVERVRSEEEAKCEDVRTKSAAALEAVE